MTSSDPDVIRRQIEDTRRELSYDVDALNEKVNPARVVDRRVTAAKGRMTPLKEKVMGSAQDTTSSAHGMASNAAGSVQDAASSAAGAVQDAASSAVGAVQQAPDAVVRQTQGNPLAAGLIAFGVGWLVSSLLPASEKEKQLAQQAESARPRAQGRAARAGQAGGPGDRRAAQARRAGRRRVGQVDRSGRRRDRQGRGPVRRRRTCRARPSSPRRRCRAQAGS